MTANTAPTNTALPLSVRDELDRIGQEITCIAALLNRSEAFTEFPTDAQSGLVGIMFGWRDSLGCLSRGVTREAQS